MANKQPRNRNWCHQYNIGEGDEMNTPLYEALKTSIKEYFNDRYAYIVKNIEKLSTLEDFYKYDMEQAIYWYTLNYGCVKARCVACGTIGRVASLESEEDSDGIKFTGMCGECGYDTLAVIDSEETYPLYEAHLASTHKPAPNETGQENGLATDFYEFLIEEARR